MLEGRSDDFKKHFCGTHFFNPPRYLKLLEIIPTPETDPSVITFLKEYGDIYLGKETVLCKDTPAFIANRVGVYSLAKIFQLTTKYDLPITLVDKLTGPAIGRPKTGTFRLADLVGHDTGVKVMQGIQQNCPDDEQASAFNVPAYMQYLLDNKFLGNKSGQGFYKRLKEKDAKGRTQFLSLNLETNAYEEAPKIKLDSLGLARQIDHTGNRVKALIKAEDAGGKLLNEYFASLFSYVSNRIPEISDDIYAIDQALKAGFAWEMGPFEYWDAVGIENGIKAAENHGLKISDWVTKMLELGITKFYRIDQGQPQCYDIQAQLYVDIPGLKALVNLDYQRSNEPVYKNDEMILHDIGDQVLCLEFRSKANAMGEGILTGINKSIEIAENGDWRGLVIGNQAQNFSVGANLMMIGMMAFQQDWDDLHMAVNLFQQTAMRCRYSSIPVVAATQGYVFGGSCETIMHCDAVMAAAESYIGLVEAGVGLIPGGGGTKEFAVRLSDGFVEGDVMIPSLIEKTKTIALASVATSAYEAYNYGYLLKAKDEVIFNGKRNITEAKKKVIELSPNYIQPIRRNDILVLGQQGLGALYAFANEMRLGKYGSDHDIKIAKKLAYVLCGGDLSTPQKVSEQYLLDVEREAFMSLLGEQKTLERIQYMLENNKPLRN
jgi:3-hydroxyacyl-CoA dehydrogenase